MSEQTALAARTSVLWALHGSGRTVTSLLVGALVAVATVMLPGDIWLILGFDAAALVYVVLFFFLMSVTTPEQAADLSRRTEPSGFLVLIMTLVLSMFSFGMIAVMLDNLSDAPRWLRGVHMIGSVLALFLSWIVLHIIFGLQYMRMYYDDVHAVPGDADSPDLAFPTRPTPDFWDFMYYSFTIAMCYQTSDVTISATDIRRLTLLHAIFSFFYFVLIISLVVNLLSNNL